MSDFYATADKFQSWAETPLYTIDVKALLESIIKSERKAETRYSWFSEEKVTRGNNVWALYSAFTNYASYADERNGFNLRNTGNDTEAQSMWAREQEVSKWISSSQFKALAA